MEEHLISISAGPRSRESDINCQTCVPLSRAREATRLIGARASVWSGSFLYSRGSPAADAERQGAAYCEPTSDGVGCPFETFGLGETLGSHCLPPRFHQETGHRKRKIDTIWE